MNDSSSFPHTIDFSRLPPEEATSKAFEIYRPILECVIARRLRRPKDDDLVQEILQAFFVKKFVPDRSKGQISFIEKWEPSRGRFRSFLLTSLEYFVRSYMFRKTANVDIDVELVAESPAGRPEDTVDVDWVYHVFDLAIARFESKANQRYRDVLTLYDYPFLLSVPEPAPTYEQLAQRFGISANQVTNLLRQARNAFRRLLREVIKEYSGKRDESDCLAEYEFALKAIATSRFAEERQRSRQPTESLEGTMLTQLGTVSARSDGRELQLDDLFQIPFDRFSVDKEGVIAAATSSFPDTVLTLHDLVIAFQLGASSAALHPERPSLEALRELKDAFKKIHFRLNRSQWKIVYCVILAAGVLGYGQAATSELTSNSPARILDNARRIHRHWADQLPCEVELLLRECIESLENA